MSKINLNDYIGKTFTVTRNEITKHVKIKGISRDRRFNCVILKDGKELYKEDFFPEDILKISNPREVKDENIYRNIQIKQDFEAGIGQQELCKKYDLCQASISNIIRNFTTGKITVISEVD
jgi:hypothetical protein